MQQENHIHRFWQQQYIHYLQAYSASQEQLLRQAVHVLQQENRIAIQTTRFLRLCPCLLLLCPLHVSFFLSLSLGLSLCCLVRRAWSHWKMDAVLYLDKTCLHGQADAVFRSRPPMDAPN